MYTVYLVSVWLHILAAIAWIGGMIFLALVLAPYARRAEQRDIAVSLIRWTGLRFRTVGWHCIAILVVTGILNLSYRGHEWTRLSGEFWRSRFGHILAMKLALVGIILFTSVIHDFVIGPRAGELGRKNPQSSGASRLRRQATWMGRLNLLLTLAVVALAVILVRGLP